MSYYVYMARCADNSLYTGYTRNIERRMYQHNNTIKGAKYTKSRRPLELIYYEKLENLSSALKREHEIKSYTHAEKEMLAKNASEDFSNKND